MYTVKTKGNIFDSDCEGLVIPVNCQGVMGKGVAKAFKKKYPKSASFYKWHCDNGLLTIGHTTKELSYGGLVICYYGIDDPDHRIICLPTKDEWRNPSTLEMVSAGLSSLVAYIVMSGIPSVAVPALGCGAGGLVWSIVEPMIYESLKPISYKCDIEVHAPH